MSAVDEAPEKQRIPGQLVNKTRKFSHQTNFPNKYEFIDVYRRAS